MRPQFCQWENQGGGEEKRGRKRQLCSQFFIFSFPRPFIATSLFNPLCSSPDLMEAVENLVSGGSSGLNEGQQTDVNADKI